MKALANLQGSGVSPSGPGNAPICPWEPSNHPVSGYINEPSEASPYPLAGYSKCRLVVDRDGYRTNSAAHLEVTGASANGLAVIAIKGLAGYVQIAIAGENLQALHDALSDLLEVRHG